MSDFQTRYDALNAAQKRAVDTIDGPVMVVAGPGTGKTELLSMRVANILRTTDALAQNILCLTYTESGAYAMRERLAGLIGADAYKVAIHTFHSFGSEIINQNAEYFYQGAYFRPADELSSYEILKEIFNRLPHDNPLSSQMNGEFTYLRNTQSAISDLKKSGLTSDELTAILDRNDQFTTWLQPLLQKTLGDRISKKTLGLIQELLPAIENYSEQPYELITYDPLYRLVHASLARAAQEAESEDSTKPLSAWKREWCEKREDGQLTLKDEKRSVRLRSVASIYYEYLVAMQRRSLFDFDDMILRTVHALEVFNDLKLNLQEQYQYILVDEFQDTNDAQMRLLWNLTNNPHSEGRPNIMVVGDDDQAIYRFQGANISNILDFQSLYRDVEIITLKDNYRSAAAILELSRSTISQAAERLEYTIESVNKTLTPHYKPIVHSVTYNEYVDESSELANLARDIASRLKTDPTQSIAVIGRHHRQLEAALPYLQQHNVPVSYDRHDNVLDSQPVRFLEVLARVVNHIASSELDKANGRLPELLSHPAWGLSPTDLWGISLEAYKSRELWLEVMLKRSGRLHDIAEWLISTAQLSLHQPLEYIVDRLTGTTENQAAEDTSGEPADEPAGGEPEELTSPLRDFFFSRSRLHEQPSEYISYLDALTAIRRRVRDYRPEGQLLLSDFVYCIDKYRELKMTIQSGSRVAAESQSVELLTAHRSKGLEFDAVYVVGLTDSVWGLGAKGRGKLINYPHNLPIGVGGDSNDEHIRLLFVALTRAKSHLILSTHKTNTSGKKILPVAYLSHMPVIEQTDTTPQLEQQEIAWHAGLTRPGEHSIAELLRATLESYRLSATHLCNYLDVSRGGPELFLLQNLLRFPQAMSPSAAFGSAIHATLQRAHSHYAATDKKRPVEDLLADFETALIDYQLDTDQHEYFLKKGGDVLTAFLAVRYDSFAPSQRVEQRFVSEGTIPGGVRLTGAIDLMDVDEETKTIVVTDYKTGKSTSSWQGKTDYEKIKLHHYRQQLMFYKLLIEGSRQYAGYTVTHGYIEYVEPDSQGRINRLELAYEPEALAEFAELIASVWQRIQAFNYEMHNEYDSNFKGILNFEEDVRSSAQAD